MKTIALIAAMTLAATQVSAQSLNGAGSDFNKGFDWSTQAKSTQTGPDSFTPAIFWTLVALLLIAASQGTSAPAK